MFACRQVALESGAVAEHAVPLLAVNPEIHWSILNVLRMIANDFQACRRLFHRSSLLALTLLAACSGSQDSQAAPTFVERSRQSMGTLLRVGVWTTNEAKANDGIEHVFREFDRLEALLS